MTNYNARAEVRRWLLDYAWSGTPEEKEREVNCILSQEDWKYLDARVERDMGQWSEEGDHRQVLNEAWGFELSALYECHDEPHLATCPRWKEAL